jgi:tetratricopeptide (TPR) repeat protein
MKDDRRAQFDRLVIAAVAHHEAGRLPQAEAAYRAALEILPGHAAVIHNLGIVAANRGDHVAAIERFDLSIQTDPHYSSAHYNRAISLQALGRRDEAIRSFSRAAALEPEHYASHRALGFLLLQQGDRERALDHFARTYELRRGEDRTGIASASLASATRAKLLHDAEQFHYLARRRRDGERFELLARNYETVGRNFPQTVTRLSDADLDLLGEDYNTAISLADAPEIAAGTVCKRSDSAKIAQLFSIGHSGAAYFDGFLTAQALASLKRYLLESTIWHDFGHIGGFVASYLEDGLACPLVLQIVEEVRAAFPDLLAQYPLSQAWAFKGLVSKSAVDVHADDAALSLNFWVTRLDANLRPGHGGLVVYRTPPPTDWAVEGYETDRSRIATFLEQNAGGKLVVPYRENRAVLFESRLFHHSDDVEFQAGYEDHRINISLLFGARPAGHEQTLPHRAAVPGTSQRN